VRNAALLTGRLPLWSPDLFMGVPLLANSQLGTFYPPNWLVAPLSAPDGVRVSILLHVFWAALGVYRLARATLGVTRPAALIGAVLFALGGYVGAHVEQINQLQGLAWMPWLFWLLARALERPLRFIPWLAVALALQFFTGHTQTVFITGLGLALYTLLTRPLRGLIALAFAGGLAFALASPQLIPTFELTQVSNRSGGMTPNQATAFSFSPFVAGRGLLPSYDSLIFGEYVAYLGVIGLGLAVLGVFFPSPQPLSHTRGERGFLSHKVVWLVVALVGLALAFGLYNPLYWTLASLPGFNLFRVPARWLALFALGAAMLASLGAQYWLNGQRPRPRALIVAVGLVVLLGISTALTSRNPDGTPSPPPTLTTILGWGVGLVVFVLLQLQRKDAKAQERREVFIKNPFASLRLSAFALNRQAYVLVGLVGLELFAASLVQPYNDLSAPEAYSAQRFTISQMRAYNDSQTPPGRFLSISDLLFDPGDRTALEARYRALGLSESAIRHAFVAIKMKETLAANLPLTWGIPTIDGFDGGVLPTAYYSAFTSLLIPEGELRTIDGRLREILARGNCQGACVPDQRWLDLTNTRYLITDKVYDVVVDGIFYDTQFPTVLEPGQRASLNNPTGFEADALNILCSGGDSCALQVSFHYADSSSEILDALPPREMDGHTQAQFSPAQPSAPVRIEIAAPQNPARFVAATLVDTRTGDFQQLTPFPWTRVLSSDIKIYENGAVLPRALVIYDSLVTPDSDIGTETALAIMRAPDFDAAQTVVLSSDEPLTLSSSPPGGGENAETTSVSPHREFGVGVTDYTTDRVTLQVSAAQPGYLLLTDAYYPGWTVTVNGQPAPIYRANVMFRAVPVPQGESTVVFEYRPAWLPGVLIFGGGAWFVILLVGFGLILISNKKFTH
jgi:hypothetical protein